MRVIWWQAALWLAGLCLCANARTRKPAAQGLDGLQVIAHIPLKDSSSCRLTTGDHWRARYLYLDHSETDNLTIIDITNPSQPHIVKELNRGHIPGEVRLMVGDTGLITYPTSDAAPKTVSIVSFSDPLKPKLQRMFSNVTGFAQAPSQRLIFIVNDEGLWVLQQQPGPDVELEKEYGRHVIYDR